MTGPWAEGDTLSPSNLNKRGGGPFSATSTVNASWSMFSTSLNTTSIQSAINYAGTNNYAAVVIPQAYLPYDTSTISDIYTVHRVREGQFNQDWYDITAYGADPLSSGDASLGAQAALDAIANSSNVAGSKTLYVPPGRFVSLSPIWVKSAGVVIRGSDQGYNFAGRAPSRIDGRVGAGGPIIYVQGSSSATVQNLVSALLTGTGQAYQLPTAFSSLGFRLREHVHTLELNGLAAFCAEFTFKLATTTGTQGNILSSGGRWLFGDANTRCFSLGKSAGEKLVGRLQLSTTGAVALTGTTSINDGVVHHAAITYDGTTVRLFLDGALEASSLGAGTLVQDIAEEVILGASWGITPQTNGDEGAVPCIVDSVRISNTARYTAAFTRPTAKFTVDGNTLALLNFDASLGSLTKVSSSAGTGWVGQHGTAIGDASGLELEGITISNNDTGRGTGIYFAGTVRDWSIAHVNILFCRNGILNIDGDAYDWGSHRLFINGGTSTSRYGILLTNVAGSGFLSSSWLQGHSVQAVVAGQIHASSVFFQNDTRTVFGFVGENTLANGVSSVLDACVLNTEPGVTAGTYRGAVAFGGASTGKGIIARGCTFETGQTAPHLIVDGNIVGEFTACGFVNSGTATTIMQVLASLSHPVQFNNCAQTGTWRPWSDTTGTATIGRIGPVFSASTGSTLRFDAALADEWDLTLTSDVTQSSWQSISYGQPVSGAIKMDSTGSRLFVWPTNSKGTVTLSYGSAAVNTFSGFYDGVNVILTSVRTGL